MAAAPGGGGAAAVGAEAGTSSSVAGKKDDASPSKGAGPAVTRAGLAVLCLLAVQNCAKNLTLRAAVGPSHGKTHFLFSAAIVAAEGLKIGLATAYIVSQGGTPSAIARNLRRDWRKMVLLAVPASIYNVQQTLEYVALSNLNAAVFSVLVQCKLLSTALFAAGLMGRRLRKAQVISLVLLTSGVMLAQLRSAPQGADAEEQDPTKSKLAGVAATLGIALCSGFASVYTEKVIKASARASPPSGSSADSQLPITAPPPASGPLLTTNGAAHPSSSSSAGPNGASSAQTDPAHGLALTQIQLALTSLVIMGAWAAATDYAAIAKDGLWQGFDGVAVIAVVNSAVGGLTVAAVLRYADAILKGYATAVSVMLTGVLSALFFGTVLTTEYLLGMTNVVVAVVLYNAEDLEGFAW